MSVDAPSISKYLAIYLNDHLGGSTTGVELIDRIAKEHAGSALGDFAIDLAREIRADREALLEIMHGLGVTPDKVKVAMGWATEKLGRLKLNGEIRDQSPLSPLVELEGLVLGIKGKLAMWRALLQIAGPPPLDAGRLEELAARAERQIADVERHRLEVARSALAPR
jgi:hypothetical protein